MAKVTVTMTREVDAFYATEEDLASMSDRDIIELVCEDLYEFAEGAKITVARTPDEWSFASVSKTLHPYNKTAVANGVDCPKVRHDRGEGYLHDASDDSPYDVDGVTYCGRCHRAL